MACYMIVEISIGEALDKLSILKIKLKNIHDTNKLENINKEYQHIYMQCQEILKDPNINALYNQLYQINNTLWNIEDKIRYKEQEKIFDTDFIDLARQVYTNNDIRAAIKKQINILTDSNLIEEKSYPQYII